MVIEKKTQEIVSDAQVAAFRALHKLTWMLERQLASQTPDLAVVTAFRDTLQALDLLGVTDVSIVRVDEANEGVRTNG